MNILKAIRDSISCVKDGCILVM